MPSMKPATTFSKLKVDYLSKPFAMNDFIDLSAVFFPVFDGVYEDLEYPELKW